MVRDSDHPEKLSSERAEGENRSWSPPPSKPRRPEADPRDRELARLQKRMARLELELDKARKVIEIQSKLSALLEGLAAESAGSEQP